MTPRDTDFAEFMQILRRALMMVIRWIEKKYPEAK